jgi:hypothetical protein
MARLALLLTAAAVSLVTVPATAAINVYNGTLTGAQEFPPNASPGTGSAIVTVDDVANTLRVQISFAGLTSTTVASHIHCCAPVGANAGVATQVPSFVGFPTGVTSGTYDQSFDLGLSTTYNPTFVNNNGGSVASARATLLSGLGAGLTYLNIHTSQFPGGEIRGQLLAVPEPASWLTMLVGFGVVGWSIRSRNGQRQLRHAG